MSNWPESHWLSYWAHLRIPGPKWPRARYFVHRPQTLSGWELLLGHSLPELLSLSALGVRLITQIQSQSAQGESSRHNGKFPQKLQVQSRECWGDTTGYSASAVTNQEKDQSPLVLRQSHSETCQLTRGPILSFLNLWNLCKGKYNEIKTLIHMILSSHQK